MALFKEHVVRVENTEGEPLLPMTLPQLIKHAADHNVPTDATLEYAGCGSHSVEWVWRTQMTAEEEERHHAQIAAIREYNQRVQDERDRRKGRPAIDEGKLGF